jgi:hypothetical protein
MIHNNNSNNAPFEVDGRVSLKIEFDLAMRIADVVLASGTTDKQVLALGHNLKNLEEESFQRPRITNDQIDPFYNNRTKN